MIHGGSLLFRPGLCGVSRETLRRRRLIAFVGRICALPDGGHVSSRCHVCWRPARRQSQDVSGRLIDDHLWTACLFIHFFQFMVSIPPGVP